MNKNRNKSYFFRFLARVFSAKKVAAAPAFLVAAGLAAFSAVPAHAEPTKTTITEDVTSGDYTYDILNISKSGSTITFGDTASANAGTTILSSGTNLNISSTADTLKFGNVYFSSSDTITIATKGVNFVSVNESFSVPQGTVIVNAGAELTAGGVNLTKLETSGKLNLSGTSMVNTLVANSGSTLSLTNAELAVSSGDTTISGELSADNAKLRTKGSLTIAGGKGDTVKNLTLTTVGDNQSITFSNNFLAGGGNNITVKTTTENGTTDAVNVKQGRTVLGVNSLIETTNLVVAKGAIAAVYGKINVSEINLATGDSAVSGGNGGNLFLYGTGVSDDNNKNSTFKTLDVGEYSWIDIKDGATLTQVMSGDKYAALTLNGSITVQKNNATLTVSGDTTLSSSGSIALSESGVLNAKNVKLENSAQISLSSSSVANISSLDISTGANSQLTINDSKLVATSVKDGNFAGKLAMNSGKLTVTEGNVAFAQDLVSDSAGTIETLGDDSSITFKSALKNAGALTLSAGATYTDSTLSGATGTLNFNDDATLVDGSVLNAKTIVANGESKTVDASAAEINYLKNVTVSELSTLKTKGNFTGDNALEAISLNGGIFKNDGDLRITGAITNGSSSSAKGTIQGKNLVSIDLSKTKELGSSLYITTVAPDGKIVLDGKTSDEVAVDAEMNAKTLTIGSDTENETTKVKISDAAYSLTNVSAIEISGGDLLHIVKAWTPTQSSMTVTNAGTLTLDNGLTVGSDKDFTVSGGTANFNGGIDNSGDFALTGAVQATAKTWKDVADTSTLSLTGTEKKAASLTVSSGDTEINGTLSLTNALLTVSEGNTVINGTLSADNAELTQTKGSLTIAGGAGEKVDNLTLTTAEADKSITFSKDFSASGKVAVQTKAGTTDVVNVNANIKLGKDSSIETTKLSIAENGAANVIGKITVSALDLAASDTESQGGYLALYGEDPAPAEGEDDVAVSDKASTFKTLTAGKNSQLLILSGATLTQEEETAGSYADLTLNGFVNVSGTAKDKAKLTVSGDTTLKSTGSIELSDYGVFKAENVKLEKGAQISLETGAFADISSLDLSAADMSETDAKAAVLVDGKGMSAKDATTIKVGTLTIGNDDAKYYGVIQLTNGGKFYAKELSDSSSITLTGKDGTGNVWLDSKSQFTLGSGDIYVTESTHGEVIAEADTYNVIFDPHGKEFNLSGVGTENLVIGETAKQSLDVTIAEYYDAATSTYTYSKVNVRNKTTVTNGTLTITDIVRNADTSDRSLGDLGNASFDNATLTVSGNENNTTASVLSASNGLALTNKSNAIINGVDLAGGNTLKVENSGLGIQNAKVSGFDAIDISGSMAGAEIDNVEFYTNVSLSNGAGFIVGEKGIKLDSDNEISVNNGATATLYGNIGGTGDDATDATKAGELVLNGGALFLEKDALTVANLAVEKDSTLNADTGVDDLTVTNASVAAQQNLNVSGVALTVGELTLNGTLNSDSAVNATDLTLNNGTLSTTGDITVTNKIEDADGAIVGKDVTLNGLTESESDSASVNLGATGTLTLNGTTVVSGDVVAETLVISDAAAKATLSGSVSADETNITGTLELVKLDNDSDLGTVTVFGSGTLNISSCESVKGNLEFDSNASGATISIEKSTVVGDVTLSGEDNTNTLSLTDANITGTLTAKSGTLEIDGANTAGTIDMKGATVSQKAGSTLIAVSVAAKSYELVEDATVDADVTIENGPATIAGTVIGNLTLNDVTGTSSTLSGSVSKELTLDNSTLSVSGTVAGDTTLTNDSTLTQTAGTLDDVFVDGSKFTQEGGIAGDVILENNSTFTQKSGSIADAIIATGSSEVSIAGTVDSLVADSSKATVSGEVKGDTTLENESTLKQTAGTLDDVFVNTSSKFTQEGGKAGDVFVDNSSTFTQTGGEAGAIVATNSEEVSIAGKVASLEAKNSTVTVSGEVSGNLTLTDVVADTNSTLSGTVSKDLTLDHSALSVSGNVERTTTLKEKSVLKQTDGTLAEVSVNKSVFNQNGGEADKVILENGSTLTQMASGTITTLDVASDSTAALAGTVKNLTAAGTVTATRDQEFTSLKLLNGSLESYADVIATDLTLNNGKLSTTGDVKVVNAVENASGSISGNKVVLDNDFSGSASLTATEKLTLAGETKTSGDITAKELDVTEDGTLTANSSQIDAPTLNVAGAVDLTVDTTVVEGTFNGTGTTSLTAVDNFALELNGGDGNIVKIGSGTTTVSTGDTTFDGTLALGGANASLAGTFNEVLFSDGSTLTANNGTTVTTLGMQQGTVLEIGDKTAAATATVGTLTTLDSGAPVAAYAANSDSSSSFTVVHDVYSETEYDKLTVNTSLSNAVAVVRTDDVDLQTLLSTDGVKLDLISGTGTGGYTKAIAGDNFDATNVLLASDGRSVQVVLNYRGAARGFANGFFNRNQRAAARALENLPLTTDFVAALETIDTYQTADALDALGSVHTVSMMPAQIDAMWAHQSSVKNAMGTGSWLDYQHGKSDVHSGAWLQYVGSYDDTDSSFERKSWKRSMSGGIAGFEHAFSKDFLAGVAIGYEYSKLRSNGNKITDDAFHVDFFAKHRVENFEQRAVLSFARHGYEADRKIAYGNYRGDVSGSTDGFAAAFDYEAAYNFKLADWVSVAPVASVSAAVNRIDSWTESGASAALEYDSQTAVSALAGIGARAEFSIPNPSYTDKDINLGLSAMFTTDLGDRSSDIDATFAQTGSDFKLRYDETKPYALRLGATLSVPLTNRCAFFGGLSSELRDEQCGINGNVGVRIGW